MDGIRLIHRKFQALLEMAGVQEIEADGQTFDPAYHEAVSQAPGEEGKVVAVVQKGYRLGDRVMRPAMVIVGTGEAPGREKRNDARDEHDTRFSMGCGEDGRTQSELALLRLRNARTLARLNEREIAGGAGGFGRGADPRDGTRAGDGAGGAAAAADADGQENEQEKE